MISTEPVDHVRWQQELLVPVHQPIPLRHQQILPNTKIHYWLPHRNTDQ